ncbi:MAG: hypothetical protein V1891_00770 [bacterium]
MSNDIIDIKKIDINNPAEVEGAAETIIAYDLFVEGYLMTRRLEGKEGSEGKEGDKTLLPPFTKGGKTIYGNEIIPKLKWIALPKFGEDEIIEMFREHFTTIFNIEDYDLWAKLKQKIVADIWYEDRDGFKEKIRKALLKNEEYLTEKKIIINGREEPPTVGNWLKDYNVALGLGLVDAAKQSEFLTNSRNIKGLKERRSPLGETAAGSEELKGSKTPLPPFEKGGNIKDGEDGKEGMGEGINEKEKLVKLFQFYEKLKISSLTPQGLEEGLFIDEDGIKGVLDDGVFTKIDPAMEKRLKELQGIIDESQKLAEAGKEGGEIKKSEIEKLSEEGDKGEEGKDGVEGEDGGEGKLLKEKISNAYIFSMEEQEIIKQEEEDIKLIAKGNVLLIGKELTRALEVKNRLRVIAALRLAVKNNLLLGWAEKGGKTDGHGLETDRHGARMIRTDKSVISENPSSIRENPSKDNKVKDAKIYLTGFLKKVLQTKLGLSEHEAAKIGAHLYNLFKKQGRDVGYLAYFDEKEQRFYWMSENKNG